MEMNVKKYMVMRISRQPSPVHITRLKKKKTGERGIFQLSG